MMGKFRGDSTQVVIPPTWELGGELNGTDAGLLEVDLPSSAEEGILKVLVSPNSCYLSIQCRP